MLHLLCTILIATALSAPPQLVKFTLSSYIVPDKSLKMQLSVIAPKTPGNYTTLVYMTGLQGLLPSSFYSNFMDSIAEEGVVTISIQRLESPDPQKVTKALNQVLDWISQNFQQALSQRAPAVLADIKNRLTIMGHSAAGHSTTQYLNNTCGNVKLQILLDGVDGVDPFGIKKDFIVTPGKFLPYAVPVLVIASELDDTPKLAEPPCAPYNLSNTRFYKAMSGPKWFLNFTKYGHADFLNVQFRDLAAAVCKTCQKDCNYAEYRQQVKGAIIHFMNAIFNKNQVSLDIIENAKFKIAAEHYHDYMGYDPLKGGAFCQRKKTFTQEPLFLTTQQK